MMTAAATDATIAQRTAMAAASSMSSKTSYAAAAGTVFFGLEVEVWGVLAGILIAIITLIVNVYYQRKKHVLDVMLAHSQLEKLGLVALGSGQKAMLEKTQNDFYKEFGDVNRRSFADRRMNPPQNYQGQERRRARRRAGPSGDCDVARTMRIAELATMQALDAIEKAEQLKNAPQTGAETNLGR